MNKFIQFVDTILSKCTRSLAMLRHHIGFYLVDKETLAKQKIPALTRAEKKLIRQTWPCLDIRHWDYTWSRIWKREHGFSPYFIGTMWLWSILEKLNPYKQLVSLQHKALFDIYFPDIHFPKTFVRCINGTFYDANMRPLTEQEAIAILVTKEGFIIKPAMDTLCGQGVYKIERGERTDADYEQTIREIVHQSVPDCICQEILRQHPTVAQLNPTSINCCRATSIYLDGQFSIATIQKIGKAGKYKDNWNSSYWIGVQEDGRLKDYGYDNHLVRVTKTDNGIDFGGIQLPLYDKMMQAIEKWHKHYLPNCGLVGWDIFINDKNEITVIELNLTCPSLVGEQLVLGTFLEPYADIINHKVSTL